MRVEFKRLDVIIARMGSPPAENARVIVVWEIINIHTGLDQVQFTIERSPSPAFPADDTQVISGATPVAGVLGQLVYTFEDITPSLINHWRRYFYRVRAVYAPDTTVSIGKTWEKTPKVYELAIIERHDFLLQFITGAPSYAFIERTADAPPCTECFDQVAGRVSKSQCLTCLGTGKQRPYLDPILFYVDYNPGLHLVQMASFGEVQAKQHTCWFSAYPILKPGDIIYQCGAGDIYRIGRLGPNSEPQGVTLQQVAVLEGLDHKDVKYRGLPKMIDESELLTVMQDWDRVRQERFF